MSIPKPQHCAKCASHECDPEVPAPPPSGPRDNGPKLSFNEVPKDGDLNSIHTEQPPKPSPRPKPKPVLPPIPERYPHLGKTKGGTKTEKPKLEIEPCLSPRPVNPIK